MARQYVVVPAGFSPDSIPADLLEELHILGPDERNADVVILEDGIEVARSMYRGDLAVRLGAELPPLPTEVRERGEAEAEVLGEPKPPELRRGYPPLHQLMLKEADWKDGKKFGELLEVLDGLGWFRNTRASAPHALRNAISDLLGEHLLTYNPDGGTYHAGPKRIKYTIKEGYSLEDGVYPVVKLIRDLVSRAGRLRKWRTVSLVNERPERGGWNWTTGIGAARFWVDEAKRIGVVRETEKEILEPYMLIT